MGRQAARRALAVWLAHQRKLSYKTRRSVLKKLYPQMLSDYDFEAAFFSPASPLRFRGNIKNYIDRLIFFTGGHEKYMLSLFQDYVQRLRGQNTAPLAYVDVGANAGNHVLFMSQLAARVLAFEPFERVRRQMEDNLSLNGITNVEVFPFGLSDANESLPFYAAGESNLGASSFAREHKADSQYLGEMQLRIGDEVMKEAGLGRVDILKVDVEGFEKRVLQGLSGSLRESRPLMVVEFTATTRESVGSEEGFRALFPQDYGFFYFSKASANTGRYRLNSYHWGMTPKIEDVIACPNEKLDVLLHTVTKQ